jgi:hypothetical protein
MRRADHIPELPLEPPEERHPRCPVCGEECDRYYRNEFNDILGCEHCVEEIDAWDEKED